MIYGPVIMNAENIRQYHDYEAIKEKWLKGEVKNIDTPDWQVSYIILQAEKADKMSLRSYNFSRGYVKRALAEMQ